MSETKKFVLQDFKKRLGLVDAKGNEEYTKVAMFKAKVLDVAVKQINEHTDLSISYTLEKKDRAFKNVVFTVEPQAVDVVATLPDLMATAQPLPGVAAHQVERWSATRAAEHHHARLGGANPGQPGAHRRLQQVCARPETGKHTKSHSLSGLLLTILGIKKASNGPLFDKLVAKK